MRFRCAHPVDHQNLARPDCALAAKSARSPKLLILRLLARVSRQLPARMQLISVAALSVPNSDNGSECPACPQPGSGAAGARDLRFSQLDDAALEGARSIQGLLRA